MMGLGERREEKEMIERRDREEERDRERRTKESIGFGCWDLKREEKRRK